VNASLVKRTVIINTVLNLRKSSGITDAVIHSAVAGIDHGHETLIITWVNENSVNFKSISPKINIIKLIWNNNPLIRFFIFRKQLLKSIQLFQKQNRRVIVHDHGLWMDSNIASCLTSYLNDIPLLVSPHGSLEPWAMEHKKIKKKIAFQLYQKFLLNKASYIHATSESEKLAVQKLLPKSNIKVIALGTNVIKKEFVSKCDSKNAIFLSRIHKKKGLDILIDAWANASHDGWKMIIVGPNEGSYFDNIKKRIKMHRLEDDIKLVGGLYGNDKQSVLFNSSLFILPTYSENFGLVIPEAFMSGLPVITTNKTPWLNLQKIGCGWTISPDMNALIKAIEEATKMSPTELRSMGEIGRNWMIDMFTWDTFGKNLISTYLKIK